MTEILTNPIPSTPAPAPPATPGTADLAGRAAAARARLDAHVREIVQLALQPGDRLPVLARAREGTWASIRARRSTASPTCKMLRHFEDDWLRGGPVRRWLPKGLEGKPIYVFETGGTTGVPKSRLQDRRLPHRLRELQQHALATRPSPTAPTGSCSAPPARAACAWRSSTSPSTAAASLHASTSTRAGSSSCIKRGEIQEANLYKKHCIDQALTILAAHPNIKCMFTTPKLLEALAEKIDLAHYGITGIFCGGTELTPQFHRFAREELAPGIDFVPTYGNTLMGLADAQAVRPLARRQLRDHLPPAPAPRGLRDRRPEEPGARRWSTARSAG